MQQLLLLLLVLQQSLHGECAEGDNGAAAADGTAQKQVGYAPDSKPRLEIGVAIERSERLMTLLSYLDLELVGSSYVLCLPVLFFIESTQQRTAQRTCRSQVAGLGAAPRPIALALSSQGGAVVCARGHRG